MQKRLPLWIITIIILFAAGCVPQCTDSEISTKYPGNPSPHSGVIVGSLTPTLEWDWIWSTCNPYQFKITITNAVTKSETTQSVSGTARDYTPSTSLEAATKYDWTVYGVTSNDHPSGTGRAFFYTGPLCSNTTPLAPVLDFPADGEFVTPPSKHGGITLQWHQPELCLPHSYIYEFASDPDFINILDSGETGDHQQEMKMEFEDCSTIYWHIAAKNGNLQGPFSETRSFNYIVDPQCWMNHYLSDDVALIRGRVYLDECTQTFQPLSGGASAQGCIDHPYGIIGDGTMNWNEEYDFGTEPGMSNVVVDLGAGPCPSTGLDQTVTGANGKYSFTVLTPGEYCISVSKDQTGHVKGYDYNMMNGLWTELTTKALRTGYDLYLSPGWYDLKHNFGWDKYDAFVKPFFVEKIWCRRIPYHWCDPFHLFEIGDAAPMLARNEEGTWIMSSYQGEVCYFYNSPEEQEMVPYSLGMPEDEYIERFNQLEVFEAPPPCPTPTPTPKPKQGSPGDSCAGKTNRDCIADPNCKWVPAAAGPGYCVPK